MNLALYFRVSFRVLTAVTVEINLFSDMTSCPFDIGYRVPQILEENISSFFIVEQEGVRN